MKVALKILGYTAGVVVMGALIAPPLYWLAQWVMEQGYLTGLRKFRFPKYVNRGVLIAALLGLVPLLRSLNLTSWRSLSIEPNPHFRRHLCVGLALGVGGIGLSAMWLWESGQVVLSPSISWVVPASALATAVTVSLLEETFFRGVLLGALRRVLPWFTALSFLSVFFAVLHFIKPHPSLRKFDAPVTWLTGFDILPQSLWQFTEPRLLLGGLCTLFVVGLILGYATIRTRSLALAFGLHAGWVFALKCFGGCTRRIGKPDLWFGRDIITGAAPLLILVVTFVVIVIALRPRSDSIR